MLVSPLLCAALLAPASTTAALASAPGAPAPNDGDPVALAHYLKSSNAAQGHRFGSAIAISGDTVVVGAPDDRSNGAAGRAYVFRHDGNTWIETAALASPAPDAFDAFGASVAVWGDTIAIGAPGEDGSATGVGGDPSLNGTSASGAVFVFERANGDWSLAAYLKAETTNQFDQFGTAVALFENTLVVGAPRESGSDAGVDGDTENNARPGAGAAYVFRRDVFGDWSERAYLKAANPGFFDGFGTSVAIWGDRVLVGAPEEDGNPNGAFPNDGFTGSGAAYAFVRGPGGWEPDGYLKASELDPLDHFGASVALSNGVAVVGAPDEDGAAAGVNGPSNDTIFGAGAAFVFERGALGWTESAYLKATVPTFGAHMGASVAIADDVIAVGAPEDSNCVNQGGGAYVFEAVDGGWATVADAFPAVCTFDDDIGRSVALSFDRLVVGAPGENSATTTVDGDATDTSASDAGAATTFELDLDVRVVRGCVSSAARWQKPGVAARPGASFPLMIEVDGIASGVAATFVGGRGFDLAGCGLSAGSLGEILVAAIPAPMLLRLSPIVAGAVDDAFVLPATPGLVGMELTLQAFLSEAGGGAMTLSDALVLTIRP